MGTPIPCACCSLPCAVVDGAELVIYARHNGTKHVTRVPLAVLLAALPESVTVR